MIEYQNLTNELVVSTKDIPQNCGEIVEQITIDNYSSNNKYFLELKCGKSNKFISAEFFFSGGIGSVKLGNIISETIGKVYVQLVIRDINNKLIGKSLVSKDPIYRVEPSINAVRSISAEKTNDLIEYLFNTCDDIKQYVNDLENKVKQGYFKGEQGLTGPKGEQGIKGDKGDSGTIVKIKNVPYTEVGFTEEPQKQLDNKLNKEDISGLMMCPSEHFIEDIYLPIKNWNNIYYDFIAPANGYIYISFRVTNNSLISNALNNYIVKDNRNVVLMSTSAMPLGYAGNYQMYIPTAKGAINRLIISEYNKVISDSFITRFVYSK